MEYERSDIIRTKGCPAMGGFPAVPGEVAIISGPAEDLSPGWYLVMFCDGSKLNLHQDSFEKV